VFSTLHRRKQAFKFLASTITIPTQNEVKALLDAKRQYEEENLKRKILDAEKSPITQEIVEELIRKFVIKLAAGDQLYKGDIICECLKHISKKEGIFFAEAAIRTIEQQFKSKGYNVKVEFSISTKLSKGNWDNLWLHYVEGSNVWKFNIRQWDENGKELKLGICGMNDV